MKIACILLLSGQLAALALFVLRDEMFSPESGWGDVLVALAFGAYLIAVGAGVVLIVLFVLRLIRGGAGWAWRPLIRSLVGVGPDKDVLDESSMKRSDSARRMNESTAAPIGLPGDKRGSRTN